MFGRWRISAVNAAPISADFGFREFQDCSRLFSRLNEAETLLEKGGKKSSVFCLSATCVLGGHIWSRTCTACGFFSEGIYLWLTREAARLPRMCPEFRGGKTVTGKLHPAAGCLPSPGQTGAIFTLPFSLKARRTRPPNVKQL